MSKEIMFGIDSVYLSLAQFILSHPNVTDELAAYGMWLKIEKDRHFDIDINSPANIKKIIECLRCLLYKYPEYLIQELVNLDISA